MKTLVIGRASRVLNASNHFVASHQVQKLKAVKLMEFDQIIFASYSQKLDATQLRLVGIANWLNSIWNKRLIFLSSDHVFSGNTGLYSVEDVPDPISSYGVAKYELEKILSRFCILRFTTHGPSQSGKPLLSEIVKRKTNITLFPNQYFSPVDTARINEFCQKEGKLPKIVHLSGPRISKADFIISIIENSSSYKFDYDYTKLDHSLVDGIRL